MTQLVERQWTCMCGKRVTWYAEVNAYTDDEVAEYVEERVEAHERVEHGIEASW